MKRRRPGSGRDTLLPDELLRHRSDWIHRPEPGAAVAAAGGHDLRPRAGRIARPAGGAAHRLGRRRGAGRAGLRRPHPARASRSPRRTCWRCAARSTTSSTWRRSTTSPPAPRCRRSANVEGTRNAIELAGTIEAGCFHQVSSIAVAGLYKGEWREDMFDEAQRLDNNPYFRTKHEAERLVREECPRPWRVYRPGIVVGDSRTGEIDKVDGPYYFFKALQRARRVLPVVAADGRLRRRRDQHRPGRLRRRGDRPHRPPARTSTAAPSTSPIPTRRRRASCSTSSPRRPTRRRWRCGSTPT